MTNFCLECWCRKQKRIDFPEHYIISEDPVLCERCGKWTNIIVKEAKEPFFYRLFHMFFPDRAAPHNKNRKK